MSETGLKMMMRAQMVLICVPSSPLVAGWSPLSHTSRMLSYLVCVGTKGGVIDPPIPNFGASRKLLAPTNFS
jgi:hypothetical protein